MATIGRDVYHKGDTARGTFWSDGPTELKVYLVTEPKFDRLGTFYEGLLVWVKIAVTGLHGPRFYAHWDTEWGWSFCPGDVHPEDKKAEPTQEEKDTALQVEYKRGKNKLFK